MMSSLLYFFLSLSIRLNYILCIFSSFHHVYFFPMCFTAESASDAISWETSEVISLDIKHHL